jgi:ATP-dependent DNA ligase
MNLPVMPPIEPMLAQLAHEVPEGDFLYEPKWDGFRALVFRDGDELKIMSRNDRPLDRYFPELVESLRDRLPPRVVLDGEIVIVGERGLDFDALQLRLHPAKTRVAMLARESPSQLVAFDVLALGDEDLRSRPQRERRAALEQLLAGATPPLHLTPATTDAALARAWFTRFEGAGFDGVMAKPRDQPYAEGERVMIKVKHTRTADVVVGGYRLGKDGKGIASLMLGLYDGEGTLHSVGVASGFAAAARKQLAVAVAPYEEGAAEGHPWNCDGGPESQRKPGGQSRWTGDKDLTWTARRPELVAEVAYDHLQGTRFRHATRFVRWRPDREAKSCTYSQLEVAPPAELADIFRDAT